MQCASKLNYHANGTYNYHVPPCGKCLACLSTSRHQWASRLLLERKSSNAATFFTLTFDPENLPEPEELKPIFQKFIKRVNKAENSQPRYFSCMEYGSRNGRPHFHGIFFNRQVTYEKRRSIDGKRYLTDPTIEDPWGLGSTYSKDCPQSGQGMNIMRYVANYILKDKWQNSGSENPKEWALMSRNPYLGSPAKKYLLDALVTRNGARHCAILGTIPDKFKMAGKTWKIPLRMRREIGAELNYPVNPIPFSDGTIITLDNGLEVRNEKPRPQVSYQEATALCRKLSSKIKQLRNSNTTPATG